MKHQKNASNFLHDFATKNLWKVYLNIKIFYTHSSYQAGWFTVVSWSSPLYIPNFSAHNRQNDFLGSYAVVFFISILAHRVLFYIRTNKCPHARKV